VQVPDLAWTAEAGALRGRSLGAAREMSPWVLILWEVHQFSSLWMLNIIRADGIGCSYVGSDILVRSR